jgi:hypothetical protein
MHFRRHSPLLALCLVTISGCVNPFPVGPGRVQVQLDTASVQRVTRGTLLPGSDPEWRNRDTTVVRFDFSSTTNLVRYFDDWDRDVHTRCFVNAAEDGRRYSGFAIGPLQDGVDISFLGAHRKETIDRDPDSAGRYRYTVYALLDLKADDEQYVDGKPRGTFDLASQRFRDVSCFVIGVTKAPVIFPRTNAFSMDAQAIKNGIADR